MATIYYDADAPLDPLRERTVAVIGYGSQGHAHALNLRDSGIDVVVGLYPGSASWSKAEGEGLRVLTVAEAVEGADVVAILAPDHIQKAIYDREISRQFRSGAALLFAHGFNIHFGQIQPLPEVDVIMVAPKSPGHRMRELFTEGASVPALLAVHQDATGHAKEIALAYARALGCTKAGVIETTFREETETDLFGEQAVLCGGVSELIKAGLSDTAEFGDYSRGRRVVDSHVRATMQQILQEVQDGSFAREWVLENQAGRPMFSARRRAETEHPIEVVGRRLRAMMPYLGRPKRQPVGTAS